ncbi:ATP synthase F0 subunit B [soil metagenome]
MTFDWWTLGLQTVNIVILVWLLGHFFWRPVAGMIEQRRLSMQKVVGDAEAKNAKAEAALAEIETTRAGFATEREAILKAARETADKAAKERLKQVAGEAEALEVSAKAARDAERAAVDADWTARASRLAVDIAGRLAGRLDGEAVRAAFLDWLLQQIRDLPESDRNALGAKGVALEAVTAAPLGAGDQAKYRKLICDALGVKPKIGFITDPALIAGLELRGPHFVVANSWRADLARILADLSHDKS